jgi:hypothetical protein
MYHLRLLNKQYTNHIVIPMSDTIQKETKKIINILYFYKVARLIFINKPDQHILVWKTCDFLQRDRAEIVNSEANLIKEIQDLGYEVEHSYKVFIVRNHDTCITTYHILENIFDYSASLILIHSRMLRSDGLIFMNKQYINSYFGLELKTEDCINMVVENYKCIELSDNIKIHYCFKNDKLVKQYILIDEHINNNSLENLFTFMKNRMPRTSDKKSCMLEIIYLITSYTQEELLDKIGREQYQKMNYLCNYKIQEAYSTVTVYYVQKY